MPKSAQALGNYWFPTQSKLAFQSAIEKEVIAQGDSHNPDDPHYKHLKDSILNVYKVNEVTKLPFNYSGFVMKQGEKITSTMAFSKSITVAFPAMLSLFLWIILVVGWLVFTSKRAKAI